MNPAVLQTVIYSVRFDSYLNTNTCSVYSIQVEEGALCRPALQRGRPCPWLYGSWSTCSFGDCKTWRVGRGALHHFDEKEGIFMYPGSLDGTFPKSFFI